MRMRRNFILVWFTLFIAAVSGALPALRQTENPHPVNSGAGSSRTEQPDASDCSNFLPYTPNPNHIWNRVHRQLLERHDAKGKVWGCDEVDPLLRPESKHVLAGRAYKETVRLLDEFTSTHAEELIHDPLPRAAFQRDLWGVFDWLARRSDDHPRERAELERRLAAIIKAVALTRPEIERLPDNYARLRGTTIGDGLALPDPSCGWLLIGRDDATPVAPIHSFAFPRSLFLVYLKLPPGGLDSSAYLESIRAYSRQRPPGDDCQAHACSPPQFPVGTEVALVRRALLIDTEGRPVVSPIAESVQLRRYTRIPPEFTIDYAGEMQQVAEFQLTRRTLSQRALGLRRVGESEMQVRMFLTQDISDPFEGAGDGRDTRSATLRMCRVCHQGVGVRSFTSYSRVQFEPNHPFVLVRVSTEAQEAAAAIKYLEACEEWGRLRWLLRRGP